MLTMTKTRGIDVFPILGKIIVSAKSVFCNKPRRSLHIELNKYLRLFVAIAAYKNSK